MAMSVLNNSMTMMGLGELNKNITRVGRDLRKLSSGEAIPGFGYNPADAAISEKMRELVRSLSQNERNVQTGTNLLNVASGGVQEQLEILKTIKQKVLDAANDSNTDIDRAIIQKEIQQGFLQIEDIAQTTTYNGRRLLAGDVTDIHTAMKPGVVKRMVLEPGEDIWRKLDAPEFIENSDAELIADVYPELDGIEGPFDVFKELKPATYPIAVGVLGLEASNNQFSGGTDGDPKRIYFDLAGNSSYSTPQDLDGKGFSVGSRRYVFSADPSKAYNPSRYTIIDISGASNLNDVANLAANAINSNNSAYNVTANGTRLEFETEDVSDLAANINNRPGVEGFSDSASSGTRLVPGTGTPATYGPTTKTLTVAAASIPNLPATFAGGENGRDPVYEYRMVPDDKGDDVDKKTTYHQERVEPPIDPGEPGKRAYVTRDFSSAQAGTMIKLHGSGDVYLQFVSGSSAPTEILGQDNRSANPRIFTVGLNFRSTSNNMASATGMQLDMTQGLSKITFRDANTRGGSAPNGNWSIDNVPNDLTYNVQEITTPGTPPEYETVPYEPVTALDTTGMNIEESARDATYATFNMVFSNIDDIESVIGELNGKSIRFSGGLSYAFVDRATLSDRPGGVFVGLSGNQVDLNELRSLAATEGDNHSALQKFLKNHISPNQATATSDGLTVQAAQIGTPGNSEYITASEAGMLRHIDIDFTGKTPSSLIGKGFRVYCATDANEWWNFQFTGKQDPEFEDEKPAAGDSGNEIKTIRIDISEAQTSGDIVKAVFEQAGPKLTSVPKFNHNLRMEVNPNTNILRLYDKRTNELDSTNYDTLMGKGGPDDSKGWWKVADGIIDDVIIETGDKWVEKEFIEEVPTKVESKDFVIHDGPHANLRLFLKLPQTTLDKVLGYDKSEHLPEDFNVMTKEMRDKLLGSRTVDSGDDPEVNGILDKGIMYLTDANILLGSEIQRLKMSEANIVNKIETTRGSESVIRDADMAKEMVSFVKDNVLQQSSQAMLSQANQSLAGVLELLQ